MSFVHKHATIQTCSCGDRHICQIHANRFDVPRVLMRRPRRRIIHRRYPIQRRFVPQYLPEPGPCPWCIFLSNTPEIHEVAFTIDIVTTLEIIHEDFEYAVEEGDIEFRSINWVQLEDLAQTLIHMGRFSVEIEEHYYTFGTKLMQFVYEYTGGGQLMLQDTHAYMRNERLLMPPAHHHQHQHQHQHLQHHHHQQVQHQQFHNRLPIRGAGRIQGPLPLLLMGN